MIYDEQVQHAGLRYREAMRGVLERLVARAHEERALAERFVAEAEALLARVQP